MSTFCKDEAATMAFAKEYAGDLADGAILCLVGDLGAGKTHFVKGLAEGLGANAEVTSPTFTLVNEYRGGRLPLTHLDLYRIEDETELLELGWDEICEDGGVVVVEWADRFPDLMPASANWISLRHAADAPDGGREIELLEGAP